MPVKKGKKPEKEKLEESRINEEITAEKVRLVGDGEAKIVSLQEALEAAREHGLDLVEISQSQDMPVVKIADYSKFRFEQTKKARDAKKKQKVIHVKEIKMRPSIDSHDFEHKAKHAREFLADGDKVKFTLMFRGREMVHPDLGFEVMNKIREYLSDEVSVEKEPAQEGRNITMVVAPKSGSRPKKQEKEEE